MACSVGRRPESAPFRVDRERAGDHPDHPTDDGGDQEDSFESLVGDGLRSHVAFLMNSSGSCAVATLCRDNYGATDIILQIYICHI